MQRRYAMHMSRSCARPGHERRVQPIPQHRAGALAQCAESNRTQGMSHSEFHRSEQFTGMTPVILQDKHVPLSDPPASAVMRPCVVWLLALSVLCMAGEDYQRRGPRMQAESADADASDWGALKNLIFESVLYPTVDEQLLSLQAQQETYECFVDV